MKRIFITGAPGFLGRSIFNQLKKEGYIVLGTTTSISSDPESIRLFLEDKETLVSCLKEFQPDIVIHLAAIAFVRNLQCLFWGRDNGKRAFKVFM